RERLTDTVPDRGRTDPGLDRVEGDTDLLRSLAGLPARQRAVLVLRYYEGLGDRQIAECLNVTEGTVRSQASRGLDRLREELLALGERAQAPADLVGLVEVRHTRRRKRMLATVSAAIVLVLGLAWLVLTGNDPTAPPTPATTPSPTRTVKVAPSGSPVSLPTNHITVPGDVGQALPATSVWPEAISKFPTHAPDGAEFQLAGVLDAKHLLLGYLPAFERVTRLYAFDTKARATTLLADLTGPADVAEYFPQDFTVSDDAVYWWAQGRLTDGTILEMIWTLPRSGGPPRLLAAQEQLGIVGLYATADHVYWDTYRLGIFRVAVRDGSAVESLAGFEGLTVMSWPWAATAPVVNFDVVARSPVTELRNVLTGQRVVVAASDLGPIDCTATLCSGATQIAGGPAVVVQHLDGSERTEVLPLESGSVLGGRFLGGHGRTAGSSQPDYLIDSTTGKIAIVGSAYTFQFSPQMTYLSWPDPADSALMVVLDLGAIK
ncbi:MAG: sigma-70 family RNA polymerase sigma factor, partial [Nocardioidaceae bacterium]|nr:sigma-70 family RNA polymerase sigma factor [Nocardioidaceae bacterium]